MTSCRICIVRIQPRGVVLDHVEYAAPTRQNELGHSDEQSIFPGKCGSCVVRYYTARIWTFRCCHRLLLGTNGTHARSYRSTFLLLLLYHNPPSEVLTWVMHDRLAMSTTQLILQKPRVFLLIIGCDMQSGALGYELGGTSLGCFGRTRVCTRVSPEYVSE